MRYYTREHEWIDNGTDAAGSVGGDANTATVGITSYAQGQLGDVVFVELPASSTRLTKGAQAAVVESVKVASDVYAPVSGTVTDANPSLEADPSLVNSDPEGEGWFFTLVLDDTSELDGLMDDAAYKTFVASL